MTFFRKRQTITDPHLLPLSKIIPPIIHCFDKGPSDDLQSREIVLL